MKSLFVEGIFMERNICINEVITKEKLLVHTRASIYPRDSIYTKINKINYLC